MAVGIPSKYFRRHQDGCHIFERGAKPACLDSSIPSQRAWRTYLKTKNAKNAIRVAREFEAEVNANDGQSYAEVAYKLGVTRTTVCYNIGLLRRLPEDFINWLEQEEDQVYWAFFTEHRLRPITRIQDEDEKVRQLAELVSQVQELAEASSTN